MKALHFLIKKKICSKYLPVCNSIERQPNIDKKKDHALSSFLVFLWLLKAYYTDATAELDHNKVYKDYVVDASLIHRSFGFFFSDINEILKYSTKKKEIKDSLLIRTKKNKSLKYYAQQSTLWPRKL